MYHMIWFKKNTNVKRRIEKNEIKKNVGVHVGLVETYNWITVFGGPVKLSPPRSPSFFRISEIKVKNS